MNEQELIEKMQKRIKLLEVKFKILNIAIRGHRHHLLRLHRSCP